jgi:DNA-binding MarR family transcriptional regulator
MEFLILGLAIGGVVGAKGKQLTKPLARAYLGLAEKSSQVAHRARAWNTSLREELQEVVEEARREHAEAVARRLEAAEGAAAQRGEAAAREVPEAGPAGDPVAAMHLLLHLHGSAGGDPDVRVDAHTLSKDLGLHPDQAQTVLRQLAAEGHVQHDEAANTVSLTHQGRERADEHWRAIDAQLEQLQHALDKMDLTEEQRARFQAFQAHLDAVRDHAKPEHRNFPVLRKCGHALRGLTREVGKTIVTEQTLKLLALLFI